MESAAPLKRSDGSSIVVEMAMELAGPSDVEVLLERFLVSIVALAGAQAGAVRVLTDDGENLRLVAQLGLPPQVLVAEKIVEANCGACGSAVNADMLRWVDDIGTCAQRRTEPYFGVQCKRVLAISLTHDHQTLGVYSLFFETDARIAPQTETILRLVGQLLALTLHNARIERERLRVTVLRERQEMVNEVHDAIAQTLAYVRMRLPLLSDAMLAHDDQSSLKYFADVKKGVGEVHDNLREIMSYFRTRMDPLGLLHAIYGIADGFADRNGITLEVRELAKNLSLTDEQETQVFHIVQESLANIAKHSQAKHATVSIDKTSECIEVVIEDDGLGMIEPSTNVADAQLKQLTHLGLEIMQARAQRLGGNVDVGTSAAGGTRVRLVIPIIAPQGAFS